MKKLVLLVSLLLVLTACKKDRLDVVPVKNGTIVTVSQSMGNAVKGPFRVDSIGPASHTTDNSNWYWLTSDNGVDVQEDGYYMTPCNNCNYTWVGPSKYLPNAYQNGNSVVPRTQNNP